MPNHETNRREFLKRATTLPWVAGLASLDSASLVAESSQVESNRRDSAQAGDQYVDFALDQLSKASVRMPSITAAAEAAAERIVFRNGGLIGAGDGAFTGEFAWAAGGIAFTKQWKPDKPVAEPSQQADSSKPFYRTAEYEESMYVRDVNSNDVVVLGFENEHDEEAHLLPYINQLLGNKALVILFSSEEIARNVRASYGVRDDLLTITHDVPNGGIIQIPGWPDKICAGRGFVQRLNLWVFQAELIGAFLRRGKIPGVLLSVTYESPQIFNIPLIESYRFIPAFDVDSTSKGSFGQTFLDKLKSILGSIVPSQRAKFRQGAEWLAAAVRNHHKAFALLIHGVDPVGLPGDPGIFTCITEGNAQYPELNKICTKDDVALFVGYNWYPPQLAESIDRVGAKLILCITTVQDLPPRPVMYGTEGPLYHVTALDQLPKRDNHIYIDEKWSQYDACLKIPGYPVLANSSSRFALNVVYWHFVADTVELLVKT
jgi:uncharacterized phosphosugar-binding protein